MTADVPERFRPIMTRLEELPRSADPRLARFFDADRAVIIGRAPGRLDVMGGIADYSGSLVLEMPLAQACFAALQERPGGEVEITSLRPDGPRSFAVEIDALTSGELSAPAALANFARAAGEDWAAYVLGVVQLCAHLAGPAARPADRGFRLLIDSQVPEGKGVSSSAALEVATMAALAKHLGLAMSPEEMAAACQWVENHVVGAPCGIMDQLTAVLGRADRLLRIRCQPAEVEGYLEIPADYRFYGVDSGVRHAVSGADYTTVRAAAFMGYRIIAEAAGLPATLADERVTVEDPRWDGYLANLTPQELAGWESALPERLSGAEFLTRYGGHTDPVTRVDGATLYPVRAATRHPVLENARVERFAALLAELEANSEAAVEMGELMYAAHESYGACGLGTPVTDHIVRRARDAGPAAGLFGAKITGGGSGGTVAILGRHDAEGAVREIADEMDTELFVESGPGMSVAVVQTPFTVGCTHGAR